MITVSYKTSNFINLLYVILQYREYSQYEEFLNQKHTVGEQSSF